MSWYSNPARRRRGEVESETVRQPTDLPPDRICRLLNEGEIIGCQELPWGSNYSFAVVIAAPNEPQIIGIYKPRAGESPLWDFPDGTLYKREFASYLFSQMLGWSFIPPTTVRNGPHGVGSIQFYVEPDEAGDYFALRGQHTLTFQQMALFDIIANNADRKANHCFLGRDGRVWGIDHGLTFHPHPKLRTVIWDFNGEPIPESIQLDLQELATDPVKNRRLRTTLEAWLDPVEVEVTLRRLDRVAELTCFPNLDQRRNVPRGWW